MSEANVLEIFSSVQGEGKYLGCRQIFVRLADCNLRCEYCDTNFERAEYCRVESSTAENLARQIYERLKVSEIFTGVAKLKAVKVCETPSSQVTYHE